MNSRTIDFAVGSAGAKKEVSADLVPEAMTQAALDYRRIEKAITFLQGSFLEQPDLAAVARSAHMSEYHFQRLFSRWAGISPKRFLQFLTVEHAKRQLAGSKAVLETALDSGLSSPGRLHDLFVAVEAVTPGEYKTRGADLKIDYGVHPTRFGPCLLGVTSRGICWLSFIGDAGERDALREMKTHWRGAAFAKNLASTRRVAARLFSDCAGRDEGSLGLLVMGTNFQIQVWRALLEIPAGTVATYETIAGMVGKPTASRAVGAAIGQNTIAGLIPCHRVIRKTGLLGGYRWGEPRKQAFLAWEAAKRTA